MKKTAVLFCIIIFLFSCGQRAEKVEKIVENGVEVILNHAEPYELKKEPSSFSPEEETVIDFERDDLAEKGMGAVSGFDVDSEGNLYCLSQFKIFKFDKEGHYITKFGQKGQGPGEFQSIGTGRILESGELSLYDGRNGKFVFLSPDGQLLREIKDTSTIQLFGGSGAHYLAPNLFLYEEMNMDLEADKMEYHLTLLGEDFEKIKELDEKVYKENPYKSNRYNLFDYYLKYRIINDRIYVANPSKENFEVNIYDIEGNTIKRIRKESIKVVIPEEFKQKVYNSFGDTPLTQQLKKKGYFPKYFPPIKELYVDEKGRIYAETYEEGDHPDEEMLDIFNAEGVFIGRKSLKKAQARRFKGGRLYTVYEKESGFQKLVIFKLIWQ